jgi:23S rRNA (cytosine1962-C5)-methyltransferase
MQGPASNLPLIPAPAKRRIAMRVTPAAERALRQGHPWLFAEAVQQQSHEGQPGDLAVIFDHQRRFLAIGLYDPTSPIRVRILQHRKPAMIAPEWFAKKIAAAAQIRAALPAETNGYRLIHGENDGLPGAVIDRYAQSIVIKIYTPAWIPYLPELIPILQGTANPERIILRLSREVIQQTEFLHQLKDGSVIWGTAPQGPVLFQENGITFEADLLCGQKTGFFLDQRENRARVEKISQGKRVLNVFAYTGGFSLYAARGGAREVTSLDLSHLALEAAQRNFAHNQAHPAIAACRHYLSVGEAFSLMENFADAQQQFDIVVIDPPSFAKSQAEIDKALRAYQHLTRLGLAILSPGGVLVQASCSSRVNKDLFFEAVLRTARQAGRPLTEIERSGHALDHPVGFREGEYLKCLFARG